MSFQLQHSFTKFMTEQELIFLKEQEKKKYYIIGDQKQRENQVRKLLQLQKNRLKRTKSSEFSIMNEMHEDIMSLENQKAQNNKLKQTYRPKSCRCRDCRGTWIQNADILSNQAHFYLSNLQIIFGKKKKFNKPDKSIKMFKAQSQISRLSFIFDKQKDSKLLPTKSENISILFDTKKVKDEQNKFNIPKPETKMLKQMLDIFQGEELAQKIKEKLESIPMRIKEDKKLIALREQVKNALSKFHLPEIQKKSRRASIDSTKFQQACFKYQNSKQESIETQFFKSMPTTPKPLQVSTLFKKNKQIKYENIDNYLQGFQQKHTQVEPDSDNRPFFTTQEVFTEEQIKYIHKQQKKRYPGITNKSTDDLRNQVNKTSQQKNKKIKNIYNSNVQSSKLMSSMSPRHVSLGLPKIKSKEASISKVHQFQKYYQVSENDMKRKNKKEFEVRSSLEKYRLLQPRNSDLFIKECIEKRKGSSNNKYV